MKIWDSKSAECLVTFEPPRAATGTEACAITALSLFHKKEDLFVVCDRSSTAYLVNLKGQVLTSYSSGIYICLLYNRFFGFAPSLSPFSFLLELLSIIQLLLCSGKEVGGEFVACTLSAQCQYLYTVGQDRNLYCFDTDSGKLEHLMEVCTFNSSSSPAPFKSRYPFEILTLPEYFETSGRFTRKMSSGSFTILIEMFLPLMARTEP